MNNGTNGGNNNGTLGSYKNISECGLERGLSWDDSSGLRPDDSMDSVYTYCGGYSESIWKTLSSDGANNTDCMRTTNINGGNNSATFGVYKNVSGSGFERGFTWNDQSGLRPDDYNNSVFTSSGRSSEAFWNTLNVI